MASTPSALMRLELQADGENLNTWGQKLNTLFQLVEQAIHSGAEISIPVNANVTLTSTNYVANQERRSVLRFTGTGGYTVTFSGKARKYLIVNDSSGTITLSDGGTTASLEAGKRDIAITDGTNFELMGFIPKTGATMTGFLTLNAAPTIDLHASTKKYVDDTAFTANAGILPGQSGNSGKFLTTDGTVASWGELDADLTAIAALSTTAYGRSYLTRASPVSIDHTVSPYTAVYGQTLLVNTSGGAVTINLPAAVAGGSSIVVLDVGGAAGTNNITLDPNGAETISGEATVEIDQDHKGLTLYALAGSWGFKG